MPLKSTQLMTVEPGTTRDSVGETVLIIEDDPRMQRVLRRLFSDEGYQVQIAGDGRLGFDAFQSVQPVLVMLDLMLPEISGRELCRLLKATASETPVIVLSAITDVVDKVLLIELGADDYVTKPFSPRELIARAQACIRRSRRSSSPPSHTIRFGASVVDFSRMVATRAGIQVTLTSLEFRVLQFLASHMDLVVSREVLLGHVWGYNSYPTTRTVDNLILKLRQKLELEPASPKHLLTVHGTGYKLKP